MAYVDYGFYKSLYGDKAVDEIEFNRLAFNAERELDNATSGIDNVKKLKVAFPTAEEDAEAVKRCVCELVGFLKTIESAESYNTRPDGTIHGNIVSSLSAGNESIRYSTSETVISTAVKSISDRSKVVYDFVASRLRGIADANGVNLLYVGTYPYKV